MAVALGVVIWLVRYGREMNRAAQVDTLAAVALLSALVSPVAWIHAYTVAYLAFVPLWGVALAGRLSRFLVILLLLCSLDIGAAIVTDLARVAQYFSNQLAAWMLLLNPLLIMSLIALQLVTRPSAMLKQEDARVPIAA